MGVRVGGRGVRQPQNSRAQMCSVQSQERMLEKVYAYDVLRENSRYRN